MHLLAPEKKTKVRKITIHAIIRYVLYCSSNTSKDVQKIAVTSERRATMQLPTMRDWRTWNTGIIIIAP